jgi:hypothetical protein
MIPFWHAQWSTPPGYEFTGNLTISPDYMQYRVWERQAMREGPIVTNAFTDAPNRAHLPVFFYWAIGQAAAVLSVPPEFVYAYSGAFLAVGLALLIWLFVRRSLADGPMRWWVFLAIMFGGGLGGHFKILQSTPVIGEWSLVRRLLIAPSEPWPFFEEYRSHYVFKTLYDSHFLLLWIVALLAILALARAIERPSAVRRTVAAAAFSGMTLLHVYEGVTLMAIAAMAVLMSWRVVAERRAALQSLLWAGLATAATYVALGFLYARSGLPAPTWTAVSILFSIVVIAFPIAWVLMAVGMRDYWAAAGVRERFLLAWGAACTLLTLSAPFYPYPDRGTLTMPVPVLIIAGAIYASRYGRPTRLALLIALAVFSAGPIWQFTRTWYFSGTRRDAPFMFLSPDRRQSASVLRDGAATTDVLLAEPADLLWLAPEFPGRMYVGHFFLTPGFREKRDTLVRALERPETLGSLLRSTNARWLFVNAAHDVQRIGLLPGLVVRATGEAGTLFEIRPGGG